MTMQIYFICMFHFVVLSVFMQKKCMWHMFLLGIWASQGVAMLNRAEKRLARDVFDTLAMHAGFVYYQEQKTVSVWCIWYLCHACWLCMLSRAEKGWLVMYLILLSCMLALYIFCEVIDTDCWAKKWQHSQSYFHNFQILIFELKDKK